MSEFNDYFDESEAPLSPADKQEDTAVTAPQTTPAPTPAPDAKPPRKRRHHFWIWFLLILIVALGITVYFRYFSPYITDARVSGYITEIERRGIVFKTYEGQMISESALTDTTRVYSRDFSFSIADTALVSRLQQLQGTGRPVTLVYERYYATLPWRGNQPCVVTGIVNAPQPQQQPQP